MRLVRFRNRVWLSRGRDTSFLSIHHLCALWLRTGRPSRNSSTARHTKPFNIIGTWGQQTKHEIKNAELAILWAVHRMGLSPKALKTMKNSSKEHSSTSPHLEAMVSRIRWTRIAILARAVAHTTLTLPTTSNHRNTPSLHLPERLQVASTIIAEPVYKHGG